MMVRFWVPIIIRHLMYPKRGNNFDNQPIYIYIYTYIYREGVNIVQNLSEHSMHGSFLISREIQHTSDSGPDSDSLTLRCFAPQRATKRRRAGSSFCKVSLLMIVRRELRTGSLQ